MALSKVIGEGLGAVDSLTVDTNTLFVDASNNKIGVGTTTPDTYSDYVSSSLTTGLAIAGSFPGIQLADTDVSGSNSTFGISKAGQSTTVNNLGTGSIKFYTAGGQRVNITEHGLTFNADTASANALSDFETGSFTPTITTASSYSQQLGTYTKIGNLVNVQVTMYFVQSGTSMGAIGGLPFALANGNYISIFLKEWYSFGTAHMTFVQSGATATASIRDVASNSLTASNGSTYGWAFSLTYQTT